MSSTIYEKYEISINGMTCSGCSNYLESSLKKLEFIISANVNLITEKALIVINQLLIKNEFSENREKNTESDLFLKSAIEKIGFTVKNISRINDKENKLNRFLNLLFKKNKIKEILNYSVINQKKNSGNKLETLEPGNMINETPITEISESMLAEVIHENKEIQIDLNIIKKPINTKSQKEKNIIEDTTEILEQSEVEFITSFSGVLNLDLCNSYYRLEYDTTIIKGHELLSNLQNNFNLNNYQKNINLKNSYKIIYINEFKKNSKEIYSFTPTTNLINLIIVISLLILIMSLSMIFKNFEFAIKLKQIYILGNLDFYLSIGLLLSFFLVFRYGLSIYKRAFISYWKSKLVNMETLIALGSISAIVLTILNLFKLSQETKENLINSTKNLNLMKKLNMQQMDLSFMALHSAEAAAAVIAIFIIGKYVEERAKNNIKKLTVNMFSDEKLLVKNKLMYVKPASKNFSTFLLEKNYDMGLMEKDDFCKLKSGDFLLFDCIIIIGTIEVNENSNYGFDNIVKREVGDKLKSGSKINKILTDNCIVIIDDVVEQSLLFKVVIEMSICLNQKLKFQHFIDKIIKYFVPLIIAISILTFFIWFFIKLIFVDFNLKATNETIIRNNYLNYSFIFERAISILVVSCPCAFGLAIPTVTTIAINKALKLGILIKNLSILPDIKNANAFVFDKTGTITVIKRDVKIEYLKYENKNYENEQKINKIDDIDESNMKFPLFEAIALVEKSQKHPIAEVLYSFAVKKIQDIENPQKNNENELYNNGNLIFNFFYF